MSLPKDSIDISPKTNFNAGCTCRPTVDRLLPLNYMTNYEVYCPHMQHIKQIKTNNYTKETNIRLRHCFRLIFAVS